ncbi:DNA-binding response regulator [Clostridia bacterium]|nr:DNA-binding response regulator [Clostridia bacterium]
MKILLCDDQAMIHETLSEYFTAAGYTTVHAYDGNEAIDMYATEKPDLVVCDIMMPGRDGIDVCRTIRKTSHTPVILLTAKGEEFDKVLGLELGADDYIVKPFSPREVTARVKALLRRANAEQTASDSPDGRAGKVLTYPDLTINLAGYEVTVAGEAIAFTPKEIELLGKLAEAPGRVYSREQLLSDIWGYDYYGDTRTVDTLIKRIRKKLPPSDKWEIRSIYGIGYKFQLLTFI